MTLFHGGPILGGPDSPAFPSTGWDAATLGTWGDLFLLDFQPEQGGTFWGVSATRGRSWKEAKPLTAGPSPELPRLMATRFPS